MLLRALLVAATLLFSHAAWGCSCMPLSGDPAKDIPLFWGPSTVVVSAVAEEVTPSTKKDSGYEYDRTYQRVLWRVTHAWKGPHTVGDTFESTTETTCCMCGVAITLGQEWLLYLQRFEPYEISECSLSTTRSTAETHLPILNALFREAGGGT
jgi:hypothetical protein